MTERRAGSQVHADDAVQALDCRAACPAGRRNVAGQRPVTGGEHTGFTGPEVGGGGPRRLWPATGRADGGLLAPSWRLEAGRLAALPRIAPAASPGAGSALADAADGVAARPSSRRGDALARRARRWRAAQRRVDGPGTIVPAGARDANGQAKGTGPPVAAPSCRSTAGGRGVGQR